MSLAPLSTSTLAPLTSFENILDKLEHLTREHVLVYRIRVGQLLLEDFWAGDAAEFSRRGGGGEREMRFNHFFEKCREDLGRYGLSKRKARDSIRAAIVVRTLPPALAERLFLTQLLQLTRLADPTARARVAQAALAQDWSVVQLRDAINAVQAGLPLDGDPEQPGVQVPEAPPLPTSTPAPGRMVTRAEKLATSVETWANQWDGVDMAKLRPVQRQRLAAAVEALEAQVARLRMGLAGGEG